MNKSFLRFLISDNTKEITIMAFVKAVRDVQIQPIHGRISLQNRSNERLRVL